MSSIYGLTYQEFNKWRARKISPSDQPMTPKTLSTIARTPKSFTSMSTTSVSEQAYKDFRKATKRDVTAFETFKEEKHYNN
jgi:hypothetical protein